MRIRRLSAIFWATCIFAFVFILYVATDLSHKLPNIRPAMQSLDDDKWTVFETKIRRIENELMEHHAVVGQIQNAVNHIVNNPTQARKSENKRIDEENAVLKEPPINERVDKDPVPQRHQNKKVYEPSVKLNMSQCAFRKQTLPATDIQMLTMYERITFDDIDGGVWKQGWDIHYDEKQWSSANKLKVYIVPHSHNDPGWLKTFENYYKSQTKAIFENMVEKLGAVPGRKFIWAETSYLALWWTQDASEKEKAAFMNLLKSGNLEIVTGGWVMNDEANSHWLSIAQQLTTGHQWLLDNVDYIPKNHWSIDPFGYSSSQPYLSKLAGFDNSVIQRVHYRIKKELAMNRELEFKWRQLWDGVGDTDMFTHLMPFYSYDVPHTCGPDPKICCQFDFKRLPGNGVTCPWGVPPKKIIQKNVHERASLILDQWRKKAQLYRSDVVMVPLGDDFRYDRANEWDNQFTNYEALVDYINNNSEWNTEVQFGTLSDYFKAVHQSVRASEFPVLSGDFFTYADRVHHYWSGYYTSRPFYKRMDRVLLAYVRAAEIISAQAITAGAVSRLRGLQLRDQCEQARRSLALFQHHDGITGTSRDEVREDYAKKLLRAIKHAQSAIQQSAYFLLGSPDVLDRPLDDTYFDVDDVWRTHDELPGRVTVTLDAISPRRRLVIYNALNFNRTDILTVIVSTPHVEVFDSSGSPLLAQVSPVVSGEGRLGLAANKFELSFPATVPALSLAQYTLALRDNATINKYTSYARVRIYNADYWSVELPNMFPTEVPAGRLEDDVTVTAGNGTRVLCDKQGLLKAVTMPGGATFPLAMDFVKYGTTKQNVDNNSGAYLFIPDGPAQPVRFAAYPEIVVVEGLYRASLHAGLQATKQVELVLTITVEDNPTLPQAQVSVSNTLLLDHLADDIELGMRLASRVQNQDTFYTDLNGMQMIKRRYFPKLPLQANFYPLPAALYIQDSQHRLTLLTSTPLGAAALNPGEIQVMQDRRLSRDDNRGMLQGVLDNVRTTHTFRVLVEPARGGCQNAPHPSHPHGQLSLGAHVSSQTLLQPLVSMQYSPARDRPPAPHPALRTPRSQADVVLAAFNAMVSSQSADGKTMSGTGLTFHRVYLDPCYGEPSVDRLYPVGDGVVELTDYVSVPGERVHPSTLTFARSAPPARPHRPPHPRPALALCPMEVRSVFLNHTHPYTH